MAHAKYQRDSLTTEGKALFQSRANTFADVTKFAKSLSTVNKSNGTMCHNPDFTVYVSVLPSIRKRDTFCT